MRGRTKLLLAVALPLAVLDLLHKLFAHTPDWAYHERGAAWLVLVVAVLAGCVALTRIPSRAVAALGGVLAAGAVGNGVAAAAWDRGIPNPLVVETGGHVAAFNLADIYTVGGIGALMVALVTLTIRNRARLLPPRRVARLLWARFR